MVVDVHMVIIVAVLIMYKSCWTTFKWRKYTTKAQLLVMVLYNHVYEEADVIMIIMHRKEVLIIPYLVLRYIPILQFFFQFKYRSTMKEIICLIFYLNCTKTVLKLYYSKQLNWCSHRCNQKQLCVTVTFYLRRITT